MRQHSARPWQVQCVVSLAMISDDRSIYLGPMDGADSHLASGLDQARGIWLIEIERSVGFSPEARAQQHENYGEELSVVSVAHGLASPKLKCCAVT